MTLHTKYRPKQLDQMFGNRETIETLTSLLESKEDIPHSFLLYGPRGCGKTTLARIIAKEIGVGKRDFIEMNTSDFRGIDTIRDLLKNMRMMPMMGDRRVWFLDECHGLSKDAQDALLKALEEPPSHVYFILATTDPDKLKDTIRDRCQKFEVKPLEEEDTIALLKSVLKKEGKNPADFENILEHIHDNSLGSSRSAIVLLERVMKLPAEKRKKAIEKLALEVTEGIELCRALLSRFPWKTVARIITGLKDQDPEQLRRMVLSYMQSVLLKKDDQQAYLVMEAFRKPFYDTGRPGLIIASYEATHG